MSINYASLPDIILEPMIRNALAEDLGQYGDITTRAVISTETTYEARLNARENGVVSGMQVAALTFRLVDPALEVKLTSLMAVRAIRVIP